MKKLFTVLALTLLAVAGSFGQSIYTQGKSPFYSCSAVTATGVCAYASLPMFNYYSYPAIFTWQVTTTGSPATISTTLEGSIDGRTRLDVVTTASSTTITSATMNFVAADVGKTIYIGGAGVAGATLATTISSVTNATTAVIGASATNSVAAAPALLATFAVLDTSTSATGEQRWVSNKAAKFIRCNLGTLTGGTSPTVTCSVLATGQ